MLCIWNISYIQFSGELFAQENLSSIVSLFIHLQTMELVYFIEK